VVTRRHRLAVSCAVVAAFGLVMRAFGVWPWWLVVSAVALVGVQVVWRDSAG